VEAVCSRAIIIDRGKIVANGTPVELKQRSENAGAVTISLGEGSAPFDGSASEVREKIDNLSRVAKSAITSESPLTIRVYPKRDGAGEDLASALGELAIEQRWLIRELHREDGRLDEVFRAVTLTDREP